MVLTRGFKKVYDVSGDRISTAAFSSSGPATPPVRRRSITGSPSLGDSGQWSE